MALTSLTGSVLSESSVSQSVIYGYSCTRKLPTLFGTDKEAKTANLLGFETSKRIRFNEA